ncbi:MAG: T9SS type A sorting domain-containing protein [Bacteroidota bacterium]
MNKHLLSVGSKIYNRLSTKTLVASVLGIVLLAGILSSTSTPTAISGIVNDYTSVSAINVQSVDVADASAFSVGDKALLIQMKGAQISVADDSTYGDVSDFGNAGNYEFHTVTGISGNTISFDYFVCGDYTVADLVQLVRIPVYEDAIIAGTLTAAPWNGTIGGILAIEATGTLTMSDEINVQTVGFRGGELNGQAKAGGTTYICDFNSGQGGIKGEGITEVASAACRGKMANGGGGGNDHNAGGGGGGNYGSGGKGGWGWKPGNASDINKGGIGGLELQDQYNAGVPKLFLGGGGGGGHQNNGLTIAASNGAGIVIIIADNFEVPQANNIYANAQDAQDVHFNDGGGGGGAGGSVLLKVNHYINPENLTIDVSGGDGATVYTANQHGPGGGGGGGYVNSPNPIPNAISVSYEGGDAGLFISSITNRVHSHTTHGAYAGQDGAIFSNLVLQDCSKPPVLDLDKDGPGYNNSTTHNLLNVSTPIVAVEDIDVSDEDDTEMQLLIVDLSNPLNGTDEYLSVVGSIPANLVLTYSNDNQRLIISGAAPTNDYASVISMIHYHNVAGSPDMSDRTISMYVNDGGTESNISGITIEMSAELLPVEFIDITAKWESKQASIQWITAAEEGVSHFEIQRSVDTRLFQTVGNHPAIGGQERTSYSFQDSEAARSNQKAIYYRIKSVDFDGQTAFSSIVELKLQKSIDPIKISVYPNPATDFVEIAASIAEGEIQIVDLNGSVLWQRNTTATQSNLRETVNIQQWARGIYFVRAINQYGTETQKIVLQ